MEVRAIAKSVRISPRKMRLVADVVRNLPIDDAYRILQVTEQKAAGPIQKALKSAVANAVINAKLDAKNLYISTIMVNQGQVLKRFRPSTRGRIHPYKKRGSNLTIVLKEKVVAAQVVKGATVAEATQKAVEADVVASTAPVEKKVTKKKEVKK